MATVAFNEAVDWYGGGEEERAKQWAERAMNLARYKGDGGQLEKFLHSRCRLLKLGS